MDFQEQRRNHILAGRPPKIKEKKSIKQKSDKKVAEEAAIKAMTDPDEDSQQEYWYKSRRSEMTGWCKCGCGEKSQKHNNKFFRCSACHIFPKRLFESIRYHKLNWIELAWIGGCHNNMDDGSLENWPNMECWGEMVGKIKQLDPLIAPEEKNQKFYSALMEFVEKNPVSGNKLL